MSAEREDFGSAMLSSSGDMMGLTIDCTATQGDHMPYWIIPNSDSNQVLITIDNYTARYGHEILMSILKNDKNCAVWNFIM